MNTTLWRYLLRGSLLAAALFAISPLAWADNPAQGDMDAVDAAIKDLNKATKDAKDNKPDDATKKTEDDLDAKARKNDDTPDKDKTKKDTQDAQDKAETAAKDQRAKSNDPDKAKAYHDALEARRKARRALKEALNNLNKRISNARRNFGILTDEDLKAASKKAMEGSRALGEADKAIALGRTATGLGAGESYALLVSSQKITTRVTGTGETIGHVIDVQIQNLTGGSISFTLPPMVCESRGRRNQDYACPGGKSVTIAPHETKAVPMDGVCLVRTKPPVGKGVTGDLVINEGNPTSPRNLETHLKTAEANKLLRITKSKYEIVEKLQKQGAFKNLPYKDPQKQKDIMVQWSTWTDPRISDITGVRPATKEDLKKTVYKQYEERTPLTPEIKTKLDSGIDILFSKIELTTAKAKNFEEPAPKDIIAAGDENKPPGVINVDNPPAGTSSPKTDKDGTVTNPDGSITKTNEDGSTTTITTEKAEKGGVNIFTTTVKKNTDGSTTTIKDAKMADGTTFHSTTRESTVKNADGSTTETEEVDDEKGNWKKVSVHNAQGRTISVVAIQRDTHGRVVSEYRSKGEGGYTARDCEYYPDTNGSPGGLKLDRTQNFDKENKVISGSETTIDPKGVATTKNLP